MAMQLMSSVMEGDLWTTWETVSFSLTFLHAASNVIWRVVDKLFCNCRRHNPLFIFLWDLLQYMATCFGPNVFQLHVSSFHSCTMHLDTIKVFYLPTDAQKSCFKRILKFTLKPLLHNLMFFWPCTMNWLYINYQLDALIIIYS